MLHVYNAVELIELLHRDLFTSELDSVSSKLWTLTTPSSSNIRPLYAQIVKGRNLILAEDPRLQLL